MFRQFWNLLRHFAGRPLTSAHSADELASRRALQPRFASLRDLADLPTELAAEGSGRSQLVYTELDRHGVPVWRAA
jgi:hypothetical protein